MNETIKAVRRGVQLGLSVAVVFSAVAGLVFLVGGSAPFAGHHVTFLGAVSAYFAGGIVIGCVAGVLHPLFRWTAGVIVVGAICGVLAFAAFRISQDGIRFWDPKDDPFMTGFFAFVGAVMALQARRVLAQKRASRPL